MQLIYLNETKITIINITIAIIIIQWNHTIYMITIYHLNHIFSEIIYPQDEIQHGLTCPTLIIIVIFP